MEFKWILLIIFGSLLFLFVLTIVFYKNFFKRFWDIILSLVALFVFLPLFIVLIIVGLFAMKGNPFFLQRRPGKKNKNGNEKIFVLIKFRTMSNDKDGKGNYLSDEKRLNAYGKFLRFTSLDELPEIINILIGNMSFVGPRPQLIKDIVFMSDSQRCRHNVRPGLSGLAQVSGRNNIGWEDKINYDIEYLNNISFLGDIKILLKTFKVIIFNRNDVNRKGTSSDIDYGEWLLINGKISQNEFRSKNSVANSLMKKGGNCKYVSF